MTTAGPKISPSATTALPDPWRGEISAMLAPGESIVTSLELDLTLRLRFGRGVVVLTERQLLAKDPDGSGWRRWDLGAGLVLEHRDHAGIGTLRLLDANGLQACWRHTTCRDAAVRRLTDQFQEHILALTENRALVPLPEIVCPICESPIPEGHENCPVCARTVHAPPSPWTLFRLWRFAKPYSGRLLTGMILTLLATAASMVSPYLTMPLMDNVLIPFTNNKPISQTTVMLLLGGLAGASVLAWLLDWAKTYILALVSERIGSDLRTTTNEHLQGHS